MLDAAPAFAGLQAVGAGDGACVRLAAPPVVSVLARAGRIEAVIDKAQNLFGLALADGPRRAVAGQVSALGIGPGRWLFLGAALEDLNAAFAGLASLSDHGDGYAIFELSGPKVRAVLAKGVPLDLDVFGQDDAAVTVIAHIGAVVWRPGPDIFMIAVFRSFAESFWHWLSASAAEFGLALKDPP